MSVDQTAKIKNEFLDKFSHLNSRIETALGRHDFDCAMKIDVTRRQMLHEFTNNVVPDGDKTFFDTLEKCAADNARAITQIKLEMNRMRQASGRKIKFLHGYRKGNA